MKNYAEISIEKFFLFIFLLPFLPILYLGYRIYSRANYFPDHWAEKDKKEVAIQKYI